MYDGQIQKWSEEATKASDKKVIEELKQMVTELQELNKKSLGICDYLKDKTIENIMDMDDAELGLKSLMGDLPLSAKKES